AGAERLLIGDEAHEALDVGPAQLLVRAREARELAHVRVPPPAVPLREHGEVVVVLADDPFAQTLERQSGHRRRQPLVALTKCADETRVAFREPRRQRALEAGE